MWLEDVTIERPCMLDVEDEAVNPPLRELGIGKAADLFVGMKTSSSSSPLESSRLNFELVTDARVPVAN